MRGWSGRHDLPAAPGNASEFGVLTRFPDTAHLIFAVQKSFTLKCTLETFQQ